MYDSKLIQLLKTFEKEDWRWFRKFLLSPYFNSRTELIPFFDYLRGQAPDFKERAVQKEKIFKKLFPKKNYDEKQLSYLMNFLLGQAERYLAQKEMEVQTPITQNYLLRSLVNRQLDKHYNYQYEKSKKILNDWKGKHIDHYLFEFQLAEIANLRQGKQSIRKYDESLQITSNLLDRFYFLHKLRYSCEMIGNAKTVEGDYQPITEKEINAFVSKKHLNEDPLILAYIEAFYILKKEKAESNFEKLKELLIKFKENIPDAAKQHLSFHGINYCISQISRNINRKYYAEQCLDLYLAGINQGFLLKNGYLTPWTFKNVIKLGLNLRKYDFTEEFIQHNHKKLEEKFQEDALHFNLADINYRKKNYQEAQIHLIQVQFSDLFYTLDAKAMLLKIYYETNEAEALLSLLASFSIFLKRNKKLAKNIQISYLNFTTLLAKIVRTKKEKKIDILEKIKSTKSLTNRQWLLEVCNNL